MIKLTLKNKLLLVLVCGSVQTAVPMHMSKFNMVKFKAFKNFSKSFVKSAAKSTVQMVQDNLNWEDAAACAVLGVVCCLAYKNWAADNVIKDRYQAEIDSKNMKALFAENIEKVEFNSHYAVHWPNFGSDDDAAPDEDGYQLLESRTFENFRTAGGKKFDCKYLHEVSRGLFWDNHRAYIPNPEYVDPRQAQAEIKAEAEQREQEYKRAREMNNRESPVRDGLGL